MKTKMHCLRRQEDWQSPNIATIYVDSPDILGGIYSFICGNGRSMYGGETVAQIRAAKKEPVLVLPYHEAAARQDARMRARYQVDEIQEITEEQFFERLEVLPPRNWYRGEYWEAFQLCEFLYGDVTQHVIRVGDRYFTSNRSIKNNPYLRLRADVESQFLNRH